MEAKDLFVEKEEPIKIEVKKVESSALALSEEKPIEVEEPIQVIEKPKNKKGKHKKPMSEER